MGLYKRDSIKISDHPVKIGDHIHCGSEDIMVLGSQMILPDREIKVPCDFIYQKVIDLYRWEPLKTSHYSSKFSDHIDFRREDIMTLLCRVIFQDHVISVPCDLTDRIP